MKFNYSHTKFASYISYITQAIVNNLSPLLFVTFREEFGISLTSISCLIIINFGIQMVVDILSARYVDRIGYRNATVLSHILSAVGLVSLGILPYIINPYAGLVIASIISAVGGGLIEVVVSPIIEALPGDKKKADMSLLHSFYCWGQMLVIALSTVYFLKFGIKNWRYLPIIWAVIPFLNTFLFAKVPLCDLVKDKGKEMSAKELFAKKTFWILIILMICSGASEIAMSQWASLFAESGLKVSKFLGDLLGPCMFAFLMALVRTYYGLKGDKISLKSSLVSSSILCVLSYLLTVFAPTPILSLIGCGLCGLSVGLMWPGVYSLASNRFPYGGTAMFAFLALSGDIGCTSGPGITGFISNAVSNLDLSGLSVFIHSSSITELSLKIGLLFTALFPFIMFFGIVILKKEAKK